MTTSIKHKRGTSNPSASDLVVGELAINTSTGNVFTKKDNASVVQVGGSATVAIDDLTDAVSNGSDNVLGLGSDALSNATGSADELVAVGHDALKANTTGSENVAVGTGALKSVTTNDDNTAIGDKCLKFNIGQENTAVGSSALVGIDTDGFALSDGEKNTAVGVLSQEKCLTGDENTSVGYRALQKLSNASHCVGIGFDAARNITSGNNNTVVGAEAGGMKTGSNNIVVGYQAQVNNNSTSNSIVFGNNDIDSLDIPGIGLEATSKAFVQGSAIYQNTKTIDANYTIGSNYNAMSAGPITVSSNVTVTVGSGSTWTIV